MLKLSAPLAISMLLAVHAIAQAQSTDSKGVNMRALGDRSVAPAAKPGGRSDNMKPCPEYGAGFYRLAGSDTCVRLGGGIGTDIGTSGTRR